MARILLRHSLSLAAWTACTPDDVAIPHSSFLKISQCLFFLFILIFDF